jgi:hypothetical protein
MFPDLNNGAAFVPDFKTRARICKRLRSSGITSARLGIDFWESLKGLQLRTQFLPNPENGVRVYKMPFRFNVLLVRTFRL